MEVFISNDGSTFEEVGKIERTFQKNSSAELKDFILKFNKRTARFVKVKAICLKKSPRMVVLGYLLTKF